jgi:hypothetical protein
MRRKTNNARKKVVPASNAKSPFPKYEGIGNPGIGSGLKNINKWLRELRGR